MSLKSEFEIQKYAIRESSSSVANDETPDEEDVRASSDASPAPTRCGVCDQISHGFHFGVIVCRACAAFFRRSVAERKFYVCRQNDGNNCPIHKSQRNMCRACRFRKCEVLGMNKAEVQLNRDPIGRRSTKTQRQLDNSVIVTGKLKQVSATVINDKPSMGGNTAAADQTQDNLPIIPTVTPLANEVSDQLPYSGTITIPKMPIVPTATIPGNTVIGSYGFLGQATTTTAFTILPATQLNTMTGLSTYRYDKLYIQRMLEGYRNFQDSQKSLYNVIYPDNIFAQDKYRKVSHDEYVRMERGCLSLMFTMLNEWFQPFDSLPHCTKVSVLRLFFKRFTHVNASYYTMLTYPDHNDTRYVLHYGQYLDSNNIEAFIGSEIANESDRRILVEHVAAVIRQTKQIVLRLQRLAIREIEVAALAGVMLWNDVITMKAIDAEAINAHIFAELHADIMQTYGIEAAGARLGTILSMLHDFDLIEKAISESIIIRKIFYAHHVDVWDEGDE